jgi:Predicted Zn-dependent proteases and their inactivated homologs
VKTVRIERVGKSFAKIPFSEIDNAKRIALMREGTAAARAHSDEITQVVARYMDCDHRTWIWNSEGVCASDRRRACAR